MIDLGKQGGICYQQTPSNGTSLQKVKLSSRFIYPYGYRLLWFQQGRHFYFRSFLLSRKVSNAISRPPKNQLIDSPTFISSIKSSRSLIVILWLRHIFINETISPPPISTNTPNKTIITTNIFINISILSVPKFGTQKGT